MARASRHTPHIPYYDCFRLRLPPSRSYSVRFRFSFFRSCPCVARCRSPFARRALRLLPSMLGRWVFVLPYSDACLDFENQARLTVA